MDPGSAAHRSGRRKSAVPSAAQHPGNVWPAVQKLHIPSAFVATHSRFRALPSSATVGQNPRANRERTMAHLDHPLARRTVIKGAGLGLVAGGIASTLPPPGANAATGEGEIWSSEYWAKKGDIPLWMYRKRVGAPKPGEPARRGLVFVRGYLVTP